MDRGWGECSVVKPLPRLCNVLGLGSSTTHTHVHTYTDVHRLYANCRPFYIRDLSI